MVRESDVFDKDYAIESTEVTSKPTELEKEGKEQNLTVTGQLGYYDRLKPHRYVIKAKVIK